MSLIWCVGSREEFVPNTPNEYKMDSFDQTSRLILPEIRTAKLRGDIYAICRKNRDLPLHMIGQFDSNESSQTKPDSDWLLRDEISPGPFFGAPRIILYPRCQGRFECFSHMFMWIRIQFLVCQ